MMERSRYGLQFRDHMPEADRTAAVLTTVRNEPTLFLSTTIPTWFTCFRKGSIDESLE